MRRIKLTIWLSLLSYAVFGQSVDCQLIGEGNGDIVRLKWVAYSWPQNLEGFFIKRRSVTKDNSSSWTALHADVIYPELSIRKSLANVDPSVAEQKRLNDKLARMIAEGNAREVNRDDFYQEILSNQAQLKNLRMAFVVDYDFALLHGFGMVDRNIPSDQTYEYGLFAKYRDQPLGEKPLDTFTWKYGSRPDLALKTEVKIKRVGKKGDVDVIWKINTDEMRLKNITGFYLYKKTGNAKYEKINEAIQFISLVNKTEQLVYRDQVVNDSIFVSYAAVPVSVMGSEGKFMEVTYAKSNMEVLLVSPVLGYMNTVGEKEKPLFEWTFSKDDEAYITGFILERKLSAVLPFQKVSGLIGKEQRKYVDTTVNNTGLYDYRLITVKNDRTEISGEAINVNYTFIPKPPAPANLVGKYVAGTEQDYIELSWNASKSGATIIEQYHVYMATPSDQELYDDASFPFVTGKSCRIKVGAYQRGQWQFALAAVAANGKESEQTPVIKVFAPSKTIAPVNNTYLQILDGKVKINWIYFGESIPDLAGFRIYQNGELAANESVLSPTTKEWTSKPLEKGEKYEFEIVALTTYGIVSEKRFVHADIK